MSAHPASTYTDKGPGFGRNSWVLCPCHLWDQPSQETLISLCFYFSKCPMEIFERTALTRMGHGG